MSSDSFKITDQSGDRENFTIIPNYVLDIIKGNDVLVYCQMKRIAGEDKTCWMSTRKLGEIIGISKDVVNRTIKSLENKKLIKYIGKKPGKTAPVKEYSIENIWLINSKYFKDKNISKEKTGSPLRQSIEKTDSLDKKTGSPGARNKMINKITINTTKDESFDLLKEITKLLEDKKRHIQIIGIWIREMKLNPSNKNQLQSIIKRTVRAAIDLQGYSDKAIVETIKVMDKTEYLSTFTLSTTLKYIDLVVKSLKSKGPKILRHESYRDENGSDMSRAIYAEPEDNSNI